MDIIFNTRSSPLIDRILHCETKYNAAAEQMTSVGYILRYVTLTFLKKHIAPPPHANTIEIVFLAPLVGGGGGNLNKWCRL